MTDRELIQQALEALDWLQHHLTQHHGCLHMDPTASGIPAWLGKTEAALRERLAQPEMEPCAGRNCGSTNPNLHSAECFEDYEKSTEMNQRKPLPNVMQNDLAESVEPGCPPCNQACNQGRDCPSRKAKTL